MRLPTALLCLALAIISIPAHATQDSVEIDLDQLFEDGTDDEGITVSELDGQLNVDLGESLVSDVRSLAKRLGDFSALTVIDGERLSAFHGLESLLEQVPGADVRSLGGTGQLSTVSLRGSAAGQVLVLLDGQPLSPMQATDLSSISLQALDRIEVLRGPQAMLFGPGALGGVVNMVTVQPVVEEPGLSYLDSGLGFKEYFRQLSMLEAEQDAEPAHVEYAALAGSHGLAGLSISHEDDGLLVSLALRNADNDYSFERADGTSSIRRNAQSRQLQGSASWQSGDLAYRAGLSLTERGIPGSAEFPTLHASLARQSIWLQAGADEQRSAISAQFTHVKDPQPYLNRGEIDNRDALLHIEHELRKEGRLLRPRLDFADGSNLSGEFRAGMDASWWRESRRGNTRWSYSAGLAGSSDVGVSPLFSVAARKDHGNSANSYASLSRAVRHPSFEELYMSDSGSVRGNPDLDAEVVDSLELGYRRSFSNARLECAAFYSLYRDSIIFAPVSAYLVEARNTGEATVAGAEGMLDLQLSEEVWWTTSLGWLPIAEYASGIPLTGRSSLHASSAVQYASRGFTARTELDHSSSTPADLFGNLHTRPRSIVNLELGYELKSGQLGLNVRNLFGSQSRDAWNYPLSGRELAISWSSEL